MLCLLPVVHLLNCIREAKWTRFQTHYFSENLVAPGIQPGPLDLQPRTLTTRPQRQSFRLWVIEKKQCLKDDLKEIAVLVSDCTVHLCTITSLTVKISVTMATLLKRGMLHHRASSSVHAVADRSRGHTPRPDRLERQATAACLAIKTANCTFHPQEQVGTDIFAQDTKRDYIYCILASCYNR
jgi:hypothetical protein